MTRRRFFAPPTSFHDGRVVLDADETRHLRDVLRLKTDAEVNVFNGVGQEFVCRIIDVGRHETRLEVVNEVSPARPESSLKLTLCLALLKGEKFDLVVQKGTELGISQFIPVTTRFADIQLRDEADTKKKVARWQRIALEAAKQSGRARVPEISPPVSFETLITGTKADSGHLMFSERNGESLQETKLQVGIENVVALVGSEGGWSDEEIEAAKNSGWNVVTLGGRILRAETAGIAVGAILQHLYGDLK